MPLYDYACDGCGPFRAWRPMDEAAAPADCPGCGAASARAIAAPYLPGLGGSLRRAMDSAERSTDEPRVVRQQDLERIGRPKGHAHHQHHHHAQGSPMRRWMLGH